VYPEQNDQFQVTFLAIFLCLLLVVFCLL
jgi:hypothetical protein